MKPDWLPDWKDESAYDYLDESTTPMRQWAWEFFRRNDEYQKACDEIEEYLNVVRDEILISFDSSEEKFSHYMTQDFKEGFDFVGFASVAIHLGTDVYGDPNSIEVEKYFNISDKFGIEAVDHPRHQASYIVFEVELIRKPFEFLGDQNKIYNDPLSFELSARSNKYVSIPFDLTKSLDEQWEKAKKRLTKFISAIEKRKEIGGDIPKRKQVKLYKKYLRVLDGRASRASLTILAKALSGNYNKGGVKDITKGVKDITNWIKAAERIRDFDYYYLPIL